MMDNKTLDSCGGGRDGIEVNVVRAYPTVMGKKGRLGKKSFVIDFGKFLGEAAAAHGLEYIRVSQRAIDEQVEFILLHLNQAPQFENRLAAANLLAGFGCAA
jgi:hypothetical protein